MDARVDLAGSGALRVRCKLGAHDRCAGWQLFDPASDLFLSEGEWVDAVDQAAEFQVELPAVEGRYRVFVSTIDAARGWSYRRGGQFLLIDAEVAGGLARVLESRTTTLARLRWRSLPRSIGRACVYPVLAVWRNRSLIRSMVRRDIAGRYRGSLGGVLWTALNPLLLMAAYLFVFGVVLGARSPGDPSRSGFVFYFLAGMLPWLAFSEAVARAPQVLLEHRNFIKKLVFPVEILPVSQTLAGLVTGGFALAVFLIGLLVARGAIPPTAFWLPLLIVPQLLFTLGVCWFLAALGAYVRDLGHIMGFLLTLWFFLTPICYPDTSLPAEALPLLGKNPIYVLVRGYRAVLLDGRAPEWQALWKLWLVSAAVCILGHAWFYKLRKSFADVI